jgi:CBS domain-containing protein
MKVAELMTRDVCTCFAHDMLSRAAQLMWEHDCGAVPVVDDGGRTIGVITDRDICMAAYTQGKRLSEIPVSVASARRTISVRPDETVDAAEATMQAAQVHRVLVLEGDDRLAGVLSVGDIARRFSQQEGGADGISADPIARTLAAISAPRVDPSAAHAEGPPAPERVAPARKPRRENGSKRAER